MPAPLFPQLATGQQYTEAHSTALKTAGDAHAGLLDGLRSDLTFTANQLAPGSPAGGLGAVLLWLVSKAIPVVADWIADGNSLVFGQATSNAATKSYPAQLYADPDIDHAKFNAPIKIAVSGQTVGQMIGRQQQYLFGQVPANCRLLVVTVGGGANDLMSGTSPADLKTARTQYISNLRTWMAANRPACRVVVILDSITVNGKQYGSITLAQYATYRNQLNADAMASYHSDYGADYYANYDSRSELLDYNNGTYFDTDKQHFVDAGQAVRAQVVKPLLLAAYAATPLAPAANFATNNAVLMPDPNFSGSNWYGGGNDAIVANNSLRLNGGYAGCNVSGFTVGASYTAIVTVSQFDGGDLVVQLGGGGPILTPHITAAGTFTLPFTAPAPAFTMFLGPGNSGAFVTLTHITVN